MAERPIRIAAVAMWASFSLRQGFVPYLIERAIGRFEAADDEHEADIVLASVFNDRPPQYPQRTIGFVWENQRPDFSRWRYSVSSDFDDYGGRNCRLPLWYGQLAWPGYVTTDPETKRFNHNFEAPVAIETLMAPRPLQHANEARRFCCFVAGNAERHRMMAVDALRAVGDVDLFGNVGERPWLRSKYELLPGYRFNLCFENSAFPGYYTEKALHAWVGGCVPLYYSDPWYGRDFNPKAIVNRIHFDTLAAFAAHVAELDRSPADYARVFAEPLLLTRPSLDGVTTFLREACQAILATPRRPAPPRAAWHRRGLARIGRLMRKRGRRG
ncbi:MAG: glycosyltransferase family 10 [Bauldia sp.]